MAGATGGENLTGNGNGRSASISNTLETSKASRSIWILKCPSHVGRAWKESNETDQCLGKIILSVDLLNHEKPASDPHQFKEDPTESVKGPIQDQARSSETEINSTELQPQFTMEMMTNDSLNMSKIYSLHMSKDIIPMHVFLETNQGKISVEGKVERKFDMKPDHQNVNEYRKLCRERTNRCNTKSRQVKIVSVDETRGACMVYPVASSSQTDRKRAAAAAVKPQDSKRIRKDRGEMENILFKLFERQPNWTLKQLTEESNQPVQFLKTLLSELCIYNKKGANQGSYELKPEYKKTAQDTEMEEMETE